MEQVCVFQLYYFILIERSSIRKIGVLLSLINIFLSVRSSDFRFNSWIVVISISIYIKDYKFSVRKLFKFFSRFLVFYYLFFELQYIKSFIREHRFEFLIFVLFV